MPTLIFLSTFAICKDFFVSWKCLNPYICNRWTTNERIITDLEDYFLPENLLCYCELCYFQIFVAIALAVGANAEPEPTFGKPTWVISIDVWVVRESCVSSHFWKLIPFPRRKIWYLLKKDKFSRIFHKKNYRIFSRKPEKFILFFRGISYYYFHIFCPKIPGLLKPQNFDFQLEIIRVDTFC